MPISRFKGMTFNLNIQTKRVESIIMRKKTSFLLFFLVRYLNKTFCDVMFGEYITNKNYFLSR